MFHFQSSLLDYRWTTKYLYFSTIFFSENGNGVCCDPFSSEIHQHLLGLEDIQKQVVTSTPLPKAAHQVSIILFLSTPDTHNCRIVWKRLQMTGQESCIESQRCTGWRGNWSRRSPVGFLCCSPPVSDTARQPQKLGSVFQVVCNLGGWGGVYTCIL